MLARRALLLLGLAATVAAVPTAAAKKSESPRAKVYKASLKRVGVGPYGLLATNLKGKVQLVDGRKNDKATIHVKGLNPGVTYPWHIHKTTAAGDPCKPSGLDEPAAGWKFRALKANKGGVANAKATSKTFKVTKDDTVWADVHLPTGERIACGVLRSNKKKQKPAKTPAGKPQSAPGKSRRPAR